MGRFLKLKVLERSHVSPSQQSTASAPHPPAPPPPAITSLPLTFFDIPWLFFHPSQPLFFYDYPHSTHHFLSTSLPLLKAALSLALRHFFPLAGALRLSSHLKRPAIICAPRSDFHICLTVAEAVSSGDAGDDFYGLVSGEFPREAGRFQALVPTLASSGDEEALPLMAVQITVFPGRGFSIGIVYHHVAADERTFNNFLKTWASFSMFAVTGNPTLLVEPPCHDRTVIRDRPGLQETFLNEWWKRQTTSPITSWTTVRSDHHNNVSSDVVRSTFVVGSAHMNLVRSWITSRCSSANLPLPVHLSPYVLTCAFVWVNWVKTHLAHMEEGRRFPGHSPVYFGYIAGGLTRLDYHVPRSYIGNCVGFGRAEATCDDLVGEDAILVAASVMGRAIKNLDGAMFEGAESWISDWRVFSESELHLMVSGSPKVDFYETDFGWGRPKKIEQVSIDKARAISLHESRDERGGIEVGLSLPRAKMDTFRSLFVEGLKVLINGF